MSLRQDRVADQIRDTLALLFSGEEISDPRLSGITITAVKVTPDLQLASVYFRVLDDNEENRKNADRGFGSCTGFLRKKLAGVLDLRRVPMLRFFFDESIDLDLKSNYGDDLRDYVLEVAGAAAPVLMLVEGIAGIPGESFAPGVQINEGESQDDGYYSVFGRLAFGFTEA